MLAMLAWPNLPFELLLRYGSNSSFCWFTTFNHYNTTHRNYTHSHAYTIFRNVMAPFQRNIHAFYAECLPKGKVNNFSWNKKEQHKVTENCWREVMFIRALIVNKTETFTFSASSVNSIRKSFFTFVVATKWEKSVRWKTGRQRQQVQRETKIENTCKLFGKMYANSVSFRAKATEFTATRQYATSVKR